MPVHAHVHFCSEPRFATRVEASGGACWPRRPLVTTTEASWCALALAQRPSHLTFHPCLLSPADRSAAADHCGDRHRLGQHCACAACSCLQVFVTCSAPPNHVLQQVYKRFLAFRERHAAKEKECCSVGGGLRRHEEDQGERGGAVGCTRRRRAGRADANGWQWFRCVSRART